ncbi:hypothetical protein TPY_2336 [Sulfobacillus acidophilus TPY]|nr:hypothetical protein TPY_2336 [Sulfobacillus acidophilus TPY]
MPVKALESFVRRKPCSGQQARPAIVVSLDQFRAQNLEQKFFLTRGGLFAQLDRGLCQYQLTATLRNVGAPSGALLGGDQGDTSISREGIKTL